MYRIDEERENEREQNGRDEEIEEDDQTDKSVSSGYHEKMLIDSEEFNAFQMGRKVVGSIGSYEHYKLPPPVRQFCYKNHIQQKLRVISQKDDCQVYSLELGSGGMSSTYLGWIVGMKEVVAVKKTQQRYRMEAFILERIQSRYVVKLYKHWEEFCLHSKAYNLFIAMQFLPISLADIIYSSTLLESTRINYIDDMVRGVDALRRFDIVHCDLKPENMMINQYDQLLLVDFGLSKYLKDGMEVKGVQCGTKVYCPPEVISDSTSEVLYGEKIDIWGLGMIIWMMFAKRHPFKEKLHNIRHNQKDLTNYNSIPFNFRPLLDRCLCYDYYRATWDQFRQLYNQCRNRTIFSYGPKYSILDAAFAYPISGMKKLYIRNKKQSANYCDEKKESPRVVFIKKGQEPKVNLRIKKEQEPKVNLRIKKEEQKIEQNQAKVQQKQVKREESRQQFDFGLSPQDKYTNQICESNEKNMSSQGAKHKNSEIKKEKIETNNEKREQPREDKVESEEEEIEDRQARSKSSVSKSEQIKYEFMPQFFQAAWAEPTVPTLQYAECKKSYKKEIFSLTVLTISLLCLLSSIILG